MNKNMKGPSILSAVGSLASAFCPVTFAKQGSGGRKVTGTAFAVGDAAQRMIVSAHHVVSDPEPRFLALDLRWPDKYSVLSSGLTGAPPADIAWVCDPAAQYAVPSGSLELERAQCPLPEGVTSYLVVGFPTSKGKVRGGTASLSAKLLCAVVEPATAAAAAEAKADPNVHIALSYVQPEHFDLDGNIIVGAHPEGMSGGAVFALLEVATVSETHALPVLVGVLTEYHERPGVFLATRIEHLLRAVSLWPHGGTILYRSADA